MVRQKSELLSGMGSGFEILKAVVDEVLSLGGSDDDVRKILRDPDLRRKIAGLIVQVESASKTVFKVAVDYNQSLTEMISAGNYGWVNDDITAERFPVSGEGRKEAELVLFHFEKTMTSDQVIAEMEKAGYRPAKIEELLALGASQPDLQRQYPIVALGSVWPDPRGRRGVSCLFWIGAGRCLYLGWFEGDWGGGCRFAGLRK